MLGKVFIEFFYLSIQCMIYCLLIYLMCGSHPFFAFILKFVPCFLLFRPCLIILFGDRFLWLVCGFLSRILVFSKNLVILSVVPLMCFAIL